MRKVFAFGALAFAVVMATTTTAAEALKSGPQVGDSPGVFDPLHLTGPGAGEKSCFI